MVVRHAQEQPQGAVICMGKKQPWPHTPSYAPAHLELNIHIEEGPLQVEDARGVFAAEPALHRSKAALRGAQDGLHTRQCNTGAHKNVTE
jgi:hypothetical protein